MKGENKSMDFTQEELEILIEGVDAWADKDFPGIVMGGLMGAMFSDKMPPNKREEFENQQKAEKEKYEFEKKQRQRQSILLKAKLVVGLDEGPRLTLE